MTVEDGRRSSTFPFTAFFTDPIISWKHFFLGLVLLDVIPTLFYFFLDIRDGGLGPPTSGIVLIGRMFEVFTGGTVEELIFRGLPFFIYFGLKRAHPGIPATTALVAAGFISAFWVLLHPIWNGAPWFQTVQLVPAAIFYFNLWRGGKWAIGAIATHSVGNIAIEALWQFGRWL